MTPLQIIGRHRTHHAVCRIVTASLLVERAMPVTRPRATSPPTAAGSSCWLAYASKLEGMLRWSFDRGVRGFHVALGKKGSWGLECRQGPHHHPVRMLGCVWHGDMSWVLARRHDESASRVSAISPRPSAKISKMRFVPLTVRVRLFFCGNCLSGCVCLLFATRAMRDVGIFLQNTSFKYTDIETIPSSLLRVHKGVGGRPSNTRILWGSLFPPGQIPHKYWRSNKSRLRTN